MPITVINGEDREKLFTQVLHLLGAPVRAIELTEEQMDSLLELAIQEYEQYVNDWLIESQWAALAGLNVETQSLARAFVTRSLDYMTQYSHAYSKIVGLQAGGDSELKKDSFYLIAGQQRYQIPAGREINELLWFTRAELTDSIIDPFLGGFGGLGGVGVGGVVGVVGAVLSCPQLTIEARESRRNRDTRKRQVNFFISVPLH
jgi:hypothetical protein